MQAVHTSGVIVSLGKGLTGLISKMHVADVPLKNFEKKFAKGDKVKCLVSPAVACGTVGCVGSTPCDPVLLCPSHIVSLSCCALIQLCSSPVVFQSLCVPTMLCSSPFVPQSHCVPTMLCSSPIVSQSCCVPTMLCSCTLVSQFHCVTTPLCPSHAVFQFPCVQVPLCPSTHSVHSVLVPKRHSVCCIMVPGLGFMIHIGTGYTWNWDAHRVLVFCLLAALDWHATGLDTLCLSVYSH